jgi:hypothetical protein
LAAVAQRRVWSKTQPLLQQQQQQQEGEQELLRCLHCQRLLEEV